jgi:hypothetical protein
MPDGVDAAVDRVELSDRDPPRDRTSLQARVQELSTSHDAELDRRQGVDPGWAQLGPICGPNWFHVPMVARIALRGTTGS